MTKKNKILVAVLAILLLLSIALNAFLLRKSIKPNSKFEQIEQIDTVKVAGESIKNK